MNNFGKSSAIRLILAFAIVGLLLTIMGFVELGKDIGGSHSDFEKMKISDFREGDIIRGTITENLGQAAYITTTEYTFVFKSDEYTSAGYYVIPFYSSIDAPVPDKLMLYKTGNKDQMNRLETLEDETDAYYFGERSGTYTHISVDRAEVSRIDAEEMQYFREYVEGFVEWYYQGSSNIGEIKTAYVNAMVPFVVQYNAGGGNWMLTVGVIILVIMAVVFVIYLVKSREPALPKTTYVPYTPPVQGMNNDPFGRPTGTNTGSIPPYMGGAQTGANTGSKPPYMGGNQPGTNPAANRSVPPYMAGGANSAEVNKILNYNSPNHQAGGSVPPYMGGGANSAEVNKILNHTPGMRDTTANRTPSIFSPRQQTPQLRSDKEAMATILGGLGQNRNTGRPAPQHGLDRPMPPVAGVDGFRETDIDTGTDYVRETYPMGDSMPSVDPHNAEHVDESNGGISPEDRAAGYKAVMPHNGGIPVVNPDRGAADMAFADSLTTAVPEMPKAPDIPAVVPVQAPEPEPAADFSVTPTDPEIRNLYSIGGHDMAAVDPRTETNVDITNGGIEKLPEELPEVPAEPIIPAEPAVQPVIPEPVPQFTVQDIPTVQDVPKPAEFPSVPDYSNSYARPEFPQAPTFPDRIQTPEFPQAPKFPDSSDDETTF